MAMTPLPPGEYRVEFVRMRKIRNKPYYRMHYVIRGGAHDGECIVNVIRKD